MTKVTAKKHPVPIWIFVYVKNRLEKTRAGGICYHYPDAKGQERELEIDSGDEETKSEKVLQKLYADLAEECFMKSEV